MTPENIQQSITPLKSREPTGYHVTASTEQARVWSGYSPRTTRHATQMFTLIEGGGQLRPSLKCNTDNIGQAAKCRQELSTRARQ